MHALAVHAARLGARATKRRAACQSGSPNLSATRAAAARRRSRRSIMAGRVDVRHHFSGHNDTWQRQRFKNTTFDEYFVAACFEYAVRPPASNGVVAASEKAHAFERRLFGFIAGAEETTASIPQCQRDPERDVYSDSTMAMCYPQTQPRDTP